MRNVILVLIGYVFLMGCQKEEIEIKKSNASKGGKLELSFEGHSSDLFYSDLALVYPDHTENYTTGNANHIKYSFAKSPIPGNQTITFNAKINNGQHQALTGSYTLKVVFDGKTMVEKTFYNDEPPTVTVDLPFIN